MHFKSVTKNYLSFQSEWRQRSWSCGISKRYFLNSRSLQRSETLLTSICGLLHKECCEAKRRNFRRFKDEREVGFWCKVDKLRIHAFVFAQRNVLNIEKDKTNWNNKYYVVICLAYRTVQLLQTRVVHVVKRTANRHVNPQVNHTTNRIVQRHSEVIIFDGDVTHGNIWSSAEHLLGSFCRGRFWQEVIISLINNILR